MDDDMMNDEIDAFHKNRDIIPLEIDEDLENSDEDDELPVLDFKENDEEDEDDSMNEEDNDKGLAAKIVRTQKYLQAKFGAVDDEVFEEADEEESKKVVWGGKRVLYGADVDYEPQSSDDEDAAEEEAEVLKLQNEKAKSLSMEDFGLEEDAIEDEGDREPTFEVI
ncbi:hypothetical protein M569_08372 [Genlisea aurea]|uniref:Uncharacterized protein n=1 Tax=Genlisea aurea TaxID=192259 RepID=S8CNQ6_9LAMI|nr:hypothetical protein M569_08372 [Genlisea aurea]